MTKHIPPAPEPIEDEELAEFFGNTKKSAKKPVKTSIKQPEKRPSAPLNTPSRPTTDGFRRVVKKPAQSAIKPVKPSRLSLKDAPLAPKNPSVSMPGRIMDFVPRRSPAPLVAPEEEEVVSVRIRETETYDDYDEYDDSYDNYNDAYDENYDEAYDDDNYDEYDDYQSDDPYSEDELSAVLADFADAEEAKQPEKPKKYDAEYDIADGDYEDEDEIESDFLSEPKPLNPKHYDRPITNPFLTSVYVEKRPLSASVPEQQPDLEKPRIPAPVDRPLSNSRKKPYEPAKPINLTEKNTYKSVRGQGGKPEFTMITPKQTKNTAMLVIAIIGTILVGIIVGGIAYLIFFQ